MLNTAMAMPKHQQRADLLRKKPSIQRHLSLLTGVARQRVSRRKSRRLDP
jgi:hypothetical protein